MVDVQRAAILRSLSAGAEAVAKPTSSAATRARSPHRYQVKIEGPPLYPVKASNSHAIGADSAVSPTPSAATTTTSPAYSLPSPPAGLLSSTQSSLLVDGVSTPISMSASGFAEDSDSLFAAYPGDMRSQELDDPLQAHEWEFYYPAALMGGNNSGPSASASASTSTSGSVSGSIAPSTVAPPSTTSSRAVNPSLARASTVGGGRQGVKRPLDRSSRPSASASTSVAVASSMLAMRHTAASPSGPTSVSMSTPSSTPTVRSNTTSGRSSQSNRRAKKGEQSLATAQSTSAQASSTVADGEPPAKKTKVSRERQLKINAASRRCRKKQKLELQFLRTHVVDLQAALKEQVELLRAAEGPQQNAVRVARLSSLLEGSLRQVDEMSSGVRPSTPKSPAHETAALDSDGVKSEAEPEPETTERAPIVGGSVLSEERRRTLLNIASFMRNNISLESQSFSPEVISCLPIEMDGWQLRLAITEKNYTIHNAKFFPCNVKDMYDFCWDTNVASKVSVMQGKGDYCVVTPLDTDVAHVYSKTTGKWSLSVHGVAKVSYNSLVCRTFNTEQQRAIICQQSVLEDRDFQDESTIPWLFKRWVVFQPRVVDGVSGTYVEAYRTASYATGRRIYKENNTYDSFCEHLIRRYAESNSLLERMMARDHRFKHLAALSSSLAGEPQEETTSDRMVKDLLLF